MKQIRLTDRSDNETEDECPHGEGGMPIVPEPAENEVINHYVCLSRYMFSFFDTQIQDLVQTSTSDRAHKQKQFLQNNVQIV